jgi:signal peptidase I
MRTMDAHGGLIGRAFPSEGLTRHRGHRQIPTWIPAVPDGGRSYTRTLVSRKPLGCLFEIAETVVLTILVFFAIQAFVAQPYRVEQTSMQNTLQDGQMVLVDKLTPRFGGYSRGDIVVFQPPGSAHDGDTPFIKRVIGVAGDVVELKSGAVLVNGVALDESSYVFADQPTLPLGDTTRWVVPEGMLFVLGDHRQNSNDSRASALGPIPVSSVIGRAVVRYWPLTSLAILQDPTYPVIPSGLAAR